MIKISTQRKLPTLAIVLLLLSSLVVLDLSRRYYAGEFDTSEYEIEVLYSSEKAGWLQSIVNGFEDEWSADNGGARVNVRMTPIGTGKGTIQIAQGASEPTIWSPASSFWLPYLNTLVEQGGRAPIVDINNSPSTVISPTVIATWKNYQIENNITSMDDLRQLALNDPEFTFAHTDPYASNGGFTAVIMQVAAAANKSPENLSMQDLESEKVRNWMLDVQSSVVHYGSSTGFLGKFMASEGPSSLKAAMIYENLVVERNKDLDYRISQGDIPADQKLVAVYPDEGVLLNDHPFSILDRPYVTETDREIANDFIEYLLEPEIQEIAVEYGFRPVVEVDQAKLDEQFNEENGVLPSYQNLSIYSTSEMSGEVVQRIPDVWSATRSRSLDSTSTGLTTRDLVTPVIMLGVFSIMIIHPIINKFRRKF